MSEAKTVRLRRYSWDPDEIVEVQLTPHRNYSDDWTVTLAGEDLGHVGRYTGSLDRKVGRLRHPGKRRILWSCTAPGERERPSFGQISRAEAIRSLLQQREWRQEREAKDR